VQEVAQVLLDAVATTTGADAGRGKAAGLQLQAQQLLDDADHLEALAAAAEKDRLQGAPLNGLDTCTPDLNGLQPTESSTQNLGAQLGLVSLPNNNPVNFAKVKTFKVPPPVAAKKAAAADPKAFGVYEDNGKIEKDESEICTDNCNYRGICKENVCYCEPSFYGEHCESTRSRKSGTMSLETVILMGAGCVILSFLGTLGFLQYTAISRRQKEMQMGFNI
jgi:hypothetical protein